MAASKQEQEQPQQLPQPSYPAIEGFIEKAGSSDVGTAFASIKEGLAALKGPNADKGKKVDKAIERTEELLSYLLQVKEKLESDRKGTKGARK